jgi:hypothetical protein
MRMPISQLPKILESAAAAAPDARNPLRRAAPASSHAPAVDPGELVARALAILAEEKQAWQTRQAAKLPSRSTR